MIWGIIYLAITGLIFGALAALDDEDLINNDNPIVVYLAVFWPVTIPLSIFGLISYLITKKFLERKEK